MTSRLLSIQGIGVTCAIMVLTLGLAGCSGSTEPDDDGSGDQRGAGSFDGLIDSEMNSFVLKSVEDITPGSTPIRVDLIARNLTTDHQSERVYLDIAIKNTGPQTLLAPAAIKAFGFEPPSIRVTNADVTTCPDSPPGCGTM